MKEFLEVAIYNYLWDMQDSIFEEIIQKVYPAIHDKISDAIPKEVRNSSSKIWVNSTRKKSMCIFKANRITIKEFRI